MFRHNLLSNAISGLLQFVAALVAAVLVTLAILQTYSLLNKSSSQGLEGFKRKPSRLRLNELEALDEK
jgi:hypothetical protein